MNYKFRQAKLSDLPVIWDIIEKAICRRKNDGSQQWQDGYPNKKILKNDIYMKCGYVLTDASDSIIAYSAVLINDEPEYDNIEGAWLSTGDFVVFHRVAIAEEHLRKGMANLLISHIENYALQNSITSVKADTNFDNTAMLKLFEKRGYSFCGQIYLRQSPRKAFEKILSKTSL